LKTGDVILEVDGKKVTNAQEFRFMIADAGPGTKISMKINRKGDIKNLDFTLGDRSEFLEVSSNNDNQKTENSWLGLKVSTFTRDMADRMGVDFTAAVIIDSIDPASPADDGGLFKGDLILEVDNRPVASKSDFFKVADDLKNRKKSILFLVKRENRTFHAALKP
jgi:serine protease Do